MTSAVLWNPERYLKFKTHRLEPALDLIARAVGALGGPASSTVVGRHAGAVTSVVDLGCGPGNVTPFLLEAFPRARLVGIDASPAMIAAAEAARVETLDDPADAARVRYGVGDVVAPDGGDAGGEPSTLRAAPTLTRLFGRDWVRGEVDYGGGGSGLAPSPDSRSARAARDARGYDVVFSNATLQWLPDHAALVPRLAADGALAPGGVLACQFPLQESAVGEGKRRRGRTGMPETGLAPPVRPVHPSRPLRAVPDSRALASSNLGNG